VRFYSDESPFGAYLRSKRVTYSDDDLRAAIEQQDWAHARGILVWMLKKGAGSAEKRALEREMLARVDRKHKIRLIARTTLYYSFVAGLFTFLSSRASIVDSLLETALVSGVIIFLEVAFGVLGFRPAISCEWRQRFLAMLMVGVPVLAMVSPLALRLA